MTWPMHPSWLPRFFHWRLTSRWHCIALLFGLWCGLYLQGSGRPLVYQLARGGFDDIVVHLILSLLMGWFILPCSLLHLTMGYSDATLPTWVTPFILIYDLALLTLQGLFLRYRMIWLLFPVLVIASVSVSGCESYMATVQWG